jgi:lysophospholipase
MTACLDLAPLPALVDGTIACVKSTKGVMLRAAVFAAKGDKPRGTICLFSGRTEYIEKYAQVIDELRGRGFCVATLDWRGQGGSSRLLENKLKGHVEDYADYDADLKAFMQEIVLKSCPKPFVALSHSMGGLILLRAMAQHVPWFDKYIFCSPFWGLAKAEGAARALASVLHFFKGDENYPPFSKDEPYFNMAFKGNRLTSDEAQFNTMMGLGKTRPDLYIGAPTVGFVYQSLQAIDTLRALPPSAFLNKPMLVLASGNEGIVSTPHTRELAKRLPQARFIEVEHAEHEILMENNVIRAKFWAEFDLLLA